MDGFGSTRVLRNLNVAAVGLSLASCTAALLTWVMTMPGLATGPTTLLAGIAWALCMRSPTMVGKSNIRRGWLLSIPIAMANAGFSCAIFLGLDSGPALMGLLLGPIFGVVVWGPALIATLVCFGIPIAWSQHAAARGLAGEERGEAVVGVICTLLALLGLGLASNAPSHDLEQTYGLVFAQLAGALGALSGAAATVLALRRDMRRRHFVEKVSAGAVAGFRVDDTAEGRVLVRVTELGSGYRVANFTEELYALDQEGLATRALSHRD